MERTGEHLFSFDVPNYIDNEGKFTLRLDSPELAGSARHFLRIDTYPQNAPSHSIRHFGYWDIPLALINDAEVVIRINGYALLLPSAEKSGNSAAEISFSWMFPLEENGNAIWNFSLWEFIGPAGADPIMRDFQAVTFLWDKPPLAHQAGFEKCVFKIPVVKPASIAAMDITSGCNIRCKFCYNHSWRENEYDKIHFMSLAVAEKSFQFIDKCVSDAVNFGCVWEPTLHNDLAGIMPLMPKSIGSITTFTTNFYKQLSDAEIRAIVNSGVGALNVSIQSLDSDVCDRISGRKNTLTNIFSNLDRLKNLEEGKTILYFVTMMLRENFGGLFALASFVHERYSPVSHEFRTFNNGWDDLTLEGSQNYARYVLEQLLDMQEIETFKERLDSAKIPARVAPRIVRGSLSRVVEEYWNRKADIAPPKNSMHNAALHTSPALETSIVAVRHLSPADRDAPAIFISARGEVGFYDFGFNLNDCLTPRDMERRLLQEFKKDFAYSIAKENSTQRYSATADDVVENHVFYVRMVADDYLEIAGFFSIKAIHADDIAEAMIELVGLSGNIIGCWELGLETRDRPDSAIPAGRDGWESGYRVRIPRCELFATEPFRVAVRLCGGDICLCSRSGAGYVLQ